MALDLRRLAYFVAVAEEAHITRAAERLGMQQPPLSQQIKSLERELGAQLFHRKARGVEMTEAGRALLEEARKVFAQLSAAVDTTRRAARGEQGRICVGVTPTAPFNGLVPRTIRTFRREYPAVALTLEENLSRELLDRLRKGSVDVAFLRSPVPETQGLDVTLLLEEPLVVALPDSHPLARTKPADVAIKGLAKEIFILYGPPGSGMYDATIAACHANGFSPRIGQLAPRVTSVLGLVAAGLGISLVPESMRGVTLEGICYRGLTGPMRPLAPLIMASRRGDLSPVVRHFLLVVAAERQFVKPRTSRR